MYMQSSGLWSSEISQWTLNERPCVLLHTFDSAAYKLVSFLFGSTIYANETTITGVIIYDGIAHRMQH
jgi:hypothetical protein